MRLRTTDRMLEKEADTINRLTHSPMTKYYKDLHGRLRSNIGNYHISYAQDGVCLHRVFDNGGGVLDVFHSGYISKKDLLHRLRALRTGIEEAIHANQLKDQGIQNENQT